MPCCYRVLLCLKRALRIANAAQQMASVTRGSSGPVTLFVEILNKSVVLTLHLIEPCTHANTHTWLQIVTSYGLKSDSNVTLIRYLYFFEKGNPQVTNAAIQSLVELITNELQSDSTTATSDPFFSSTLRYIQFQKQKGGVMGEKFASIRVWVFVTCERSIMFLQARWV